jgi:hypothetical protein
MRLTDFATLIQEGYFYQDRTDRIPQLEDAGRQLIFIRPRRFGKSLLLSMLEHYYDLNRADRNSTRCSANWPSAGTPRRCTISTSS